MAHENNTYCRANESCDEIIDENTEYTKRLTTEKEKKTTDNVLDS